MTTTEARQTSQRLRTERRSIPPFGDGTDPNAVSNILDNVLAKCRFAPYGNLMFVEHPTYYLDGGDANRLIDPQFEIIVDRCDDLNDRLGIRKDDLELGLSVLNPHLRRYEVLESWTIDSIPSGPWSPVPKKLNGLRSGRGMDFVLAIRVIANRKQLSQRGLGHNKVICRKVFSIRESIDASTFPFRWVQFGGEIGYPKEALWAIEWTDLDEDDNFDRPVDQLLTVLMNEKAESALRAMGEVKGTNDLAWRILAADITTQIWADVLSKTDYEPDERDTETLVGQVFARLSRIGGMPYAEVKGLVDHDDSLMGLRNLVAKILKVVG